MTRRVLKLPDHAGMIKTPPQSTDTQLTGTESTGTESTCNESAALHTTTPEECSQIGAWIADKLNQSDGPVRFFIPLRGVSMIDAPDMPFHDPEADAALFAAIEETFEESDSRKLIKLDNHVNDQEFADALVAAFREAVSQ